MTLDRCQRDARIDMMRAIGTLFIILAHVRAPALLLTIRSFDVVMLVFISGMSFSIHHEFQYRRYLWKRVRKLVLPMWILMTVVFIFAGAAHWLLHWKMLYSPSQILSSYLFLSGGMGYVWIVRIYLLIAVVSPVLFRLASGIKKNGIFGLVVTAVALAAWFANLLNRTLDSVFLEDYIVSGLAYSAVALCGMRFAVRLDFRNMFLVSALLLFAICQLWICINGGGFCVNDHKFPPSVYYISYGVLCSAVFYKILPNRRIKAVEWISRHSYDVYLYHIVVLMTISVLATTANMQWVHEWFLLEYLLVLLLSVALAFFHDQLKQAWSKKRRSANG